jgi:tRNA(Glu) U13 pseudouridine synthase TruD
VSHCSQLDYDSRTWFFPSLATTCTTRRTKLAKLYRALLDHDAVSFRRDGPPESTAKGSYRRLVSRAYNVSFEVLVDTGGDGNLDIKLQFDLPTGSYATMFLRELMYTTVVRDNRIGT